MEENAIKNVLEKMSGLASIKRWTQEMEAMGRGQEIKERFDLWAELMRSDDVLTVRKEGYIGIVTLKFPRKGNALVPPMLVMIPDAMKSLSDDDDVRAIILTGTGRNFSSGGYVGRDAFYFGEDLGHGGTVPEPTRRGFREILQPLIMSVYKAEKPTIAMLNGPAMDIAVDLVLATDIRVGHKNSDFWFSFARTGNTCFTGCFWLLPRAIGMSRATDLLLRAKRIDGEEAYRIGLLNYLVPEERLLEETMEIATEITNLPPISLRLIKLELQRGQAMPELDFALDMVSAFEPIVQATEDHREAEEAVVEKRKPVVRGR